MAYPGLQDARLVKVYSSEKAYGTYPVPYALSDMCTACVGCSIIITAVGYSVAQYVLKKSCNIALLVVIKCVWLHISKYILCECID